jgi:opacity protein-like surface antigen
MKMNRLSAKVFFSFGLVLLAAAPAWSAGWNYSNAANTKKDGTWFGESANGKWMVGGKYANVKNNLQGADDASAAGLVLGYHFARPVDFNGTASIEFEYLTSTSDGKFGEASEIGQAGVWDLDVWSIFFAYRTPGMVFFKAKLGGTQSDVTYANPAGDSKTSEFAFAWGAGLGVKLGDMFLAELEYTVTTGDNELEFISLGGIIEF